MCVCAAYSLQVPDIPSAEYEHGDEKDGVDGEQDIV